MVVELIIVKLCSFEDEVIFPVEHVKTLCAFNVKLAFLFFSSKKAKDASVANDFSCLSDSFLSSEIH